jgi:hypothetical protein
MEYDIETLCHIKATVAVESPEEGDVDYLVLNDDRVLRIDAQTIMVCGSLTDALEGQALPDTPVIRR